MHAAGLDIENGLHEFIGDDPELAVLAATHGVELRDLRKAPPGLDIPSGANLEHVPYKGSAAVTLGLLAGEVDVMISGYSALLPHVKAGKVKILGRASLQRMAITPDVPTIVEQGFPGFEVQAWYGLFAPAGTPKAIVDQIQRGTAKALEAPDIKTRLDSYYVEAVGDTPEAFGKVVGEERARWSKLIKSLNIEME